MAKGIEIIIAGIIAGVVAYTTSILGIKGTVLGAVITSILVELLSNVFKEPFERTSLRKKSLKIIYLLPLVIIGFIELVYLFVDASFTAYQLFNLLEDVSNNNLFRIMGLSLIIMGIYPIIQPKDIKRLYGLIVLIMGIILVLRGFIDADFTFVSLYSVIFVEYDLLLTGIVIAGLAFVIFNVINESFKVKSTKSSEYDEIRDSFNKNYKKSKNKKYKHKPKNNTYKSHSKPKNRTNNTKSKFSKSNDAQLSNNNDLNNHVSEKTNLYYNTPDDLDILDKE